MKLANFGHIFILGLTVDHSIVRRSRKVNKKVANSTTAAGKTIVLTDPKDIMSSAAALFSNVKERIDCSADSNAPYSHFMLKPIRDGYIQLNKRGIKVRFITEITKENLYYSKELMKIVELRHLDGIKGNFGISDGVEYRASPTSKQEGAPSEYIISTMKPFVEQQQYFFDMLWSKAIPAEQRIRDIEEGHREEFFEVIDNPERAAEVYINLAKSTKNNALLLLPSSNALVIEHKLGVLEYLIEASKNKDVRDIRIICSIDDSNAQNIRWLHEEAPNIKILNNRINLATKVFIVNDDTLFRAELRDPEADTFSKAFGFAIYSNSKPTVGAFKSFFELVWNSYEANEKLQQADKVQREFINIAAHELRTPIVPILNLSELLYSKIKGQQREQEQEQQKEMLEIILRNANRLHQLTEDILDVTRIESNTLKLRRERFNLNDVILNVVEDYRKRIANSNVKLIHELANSTIMVEADRRRLTQVISNLLDNAIKFTKEEGTVTVTTTIRGKKDLDRDSAKEGGGGEVAEEQEEEVVIAVKDTGTGIDPELMPRLFTKFATKSYQGTGLGLFISKSIVEGHGGKMWAENNNKNDNEDKNNGSNNRKYNGATFYFTLPIVNMSLSI
jgi:two-component system, OmpR family, sensor histidine kinase VicK